MDTFATSASVLLQALSRMLFHSVWQGALMAVVAGIIIISTKKVSAAVRYNLMLCLFGLFLVTSCSTFFYVLANAPQSTVDVNSITSYSDGTLLTTVNLSADASIYHRFKTLAGLLSNYFNQHYVLIVSLWFVLFVLKSCYLAGNMVYMQRVRRYNVFTPSEVWLNKLTSLCEKLQITKTVTLLESGYLKVPVVIGYFKPVILIPIGLLAAIPVEQVEAVLLHELAHIKRSDYLVNLLQRLAETVFFFNPGLLWISHLLREERESCCDDIAIEQTNSKEDFVKALISFKEHAANYPAVALGFSGRKSSLLNRIMRIVYQENKTFSIKESSVFLAAVAVVGLTAFSFYPAKNTAGERVTSLHDAPQHIGQLSTQTKAFDTVVKHKPAANTGNEMETPVIKNINPTAVSTPVADTLTSVTNDVLPPVDAPTLSNTRELIAKVKFNTDKFYSRLSLGNGYDIIQILSNGGSKMVATLKHEDKAAIVINGVLYNESDVADLTPSQVISSYGDFNSIGGTDITLARRLYPELDLSGYGTLVIVGAPKALAYSKPPAYFP